MRRAGAMLAGALALAGCTSEGVNPIVGAVTETAVGLVRPGAEEAPATPPQVLRRADIEGLGRPAIRGRVLPDGPPTLLLAASANRGFVTYSTQLRQSLTLRGSQLTATRGLGFDLLSATSSGPDPLVQPIPPQNWPARVTRRYEFPADAPRGRVEEYQCSYSFGETQTIAILLVQYQGVEITETCRGPAGEFQNLHFAELGSGFVRRSIQWSGAEQGLIDIEIIVPR